MNVPVFILVNVLVLVLSFLMGFFVPRLVDAHYDRKRKRSRVGW